MEKRRDIRKTIAACIVICLLQAAILFVNYHDFNIRYPMLYGDADIMAVFCYAKSIDEFGITLENPMLGGRTGFDMYDYPYSDSLSFLLVKGIGLFTDNPFLIINLFFFLCSFLTAVIAFLVLQKYLDSTVLCAALGLLYANTFFYQMRYVHMWLVPYFLLPVACSLAIDIIDGRIVPEGCRVWRSRSFYKALVLAFCCAFTGLYYAYFTCALLAAALVIRCINAGRIRGNLYPVFLIGATLTGVLLSILPNLLYWSRNGTNPESELALRSGYETELYGLRLVQLFLPRYQHRIGALASLTDHYKTTYPYVNENETVSLGLIASIGCIIGIVWLFANGKKVKKTYSWLILSVFLITTIGGIGTMISLFVDIPVRCYCRMSLMITFLSLLCLGTFLERILRGRSGWILAVISVVILCVGIFDQTRSDGGNGYGVSDYSDGIEKTRAYFQEIESDVGAGSYVFELPYVRWPSGMYYRLFKGYMFTDDIHWSFGAMQGREEARWQEQTASLGTGDMVAELLKNGYDGIYVDVAAYNALVGEGAFDRLRDELDDLLQTEPIVDEGGSQYFWNLKNSGLASAGTDQAA